MSTPTEAFVLSSQRSGTTLVISMLAQVPGVLSVGEMFKHNAQINRPEFWYDRRRPVADHLAAFYDQPAYRAILFKLMPDQLTRRPEVIPALRARAVRCIHVRRPNLLQVYLSRCRARQNQQWVARDNAPVDRAPLVIDVPHMLADLRDLDTVLRALDTIAAAFGQVLTVDHDDFVADMPASMARITAFLGVDPAPERARAPLQKLSPATLAQSVANHAEVTAALQGTPFEGFAF